MRKKKAEIAPAPVETDFYTEALKAFDVALPPTEEELEALRLAEAEKVRKRIWRIRVAILAVVAVTAITLALWRPWENGSDPPVLGEPGGSSAFSDPIKISFRVYSRPGDTDPSDAARIDLWDYLGGQSASLIQQLELLDWIYMPSISFSPAPAIGDIIINQGDGDRCIAFNSDGLIFAEGYMARPDDALWNDIFDLLPMDATTRVGSYFIELADGSQLQLTIHVDGSFIALREQEVIYSGSWARVQDHLLLYTDDSQVGLCTLLLNSEGKMVYSNPNSSWLLKELNNAGWLYHESAGQVAAMAVKLTALDTGAQYMQTARLNPWQFDQFLYWMDDLQWSTQMPTGSILQMCGKLTLYPLDDDSAYPSREVEFSYDGVLRYFGRYVKLDDAQWMRFLQFISVVGSNELSLDQYASQKSGESRMLLLFAQTGSGVSIYIQDDETDETYEGRYAMIGDLVLLAGPDGMREMLLYDRETKNLTTQSGQVMELIPIIYGDYYPAA